MLLAYSLCYLFQTNINLLIGYEPPANTTSNPNDQANGDMLHVDGGKKTAVNLRNIMIKCHHDKIKCYKS